MSSSPACRACSSGTRPDAQYERTKRRSRGECRDRDPAPLSEQQRADGRTYGYTDDGPLRSARRPAIGAISAPAAPARPKAPAAAALRWKGSPCSITARVNQKALKPTERRPCVHAVRRSEPCRFHSLASDLSSAPYDKWVVALKRGRLRQAAAPISAMLAAAAMNMARQPEVPRIAVTAPSVIAGKATPTHAAMLAELPWLALCAYCRTDILLTHSHSGEAFRLPISPRMRAPTASMPLRSAALLGLGVCVASSRNRRSLAG